MAHGFVTWLEEQAGQEEMAARLRKWARLAGDMIACGLEAEALRYYDGRQALGPELLPYRPRGVDEPSLESALEVIEGWKEGAVDPREREELEAIQTTCYELEGVGLDEAARQYCLRKREQYRRRQLREEREAKLQPLGLKERAVELIAEQIEEARSMRRGEILALYNSNRPPERQYVDLDHLMAERFMPPVQARIDFAVEMGLLDGGNPADQAIIRSLVGAMARL